MQRYFNSVDHESDEGGADSPGGGLIVFGVEWSGPGLNCGSAGGLGHGLCHGLELADGDLSVIIFTILFFLCTSAHILILYFFSVCRCLSMYVVVFT